MPKDYCQYPLREKTESGIPIKSYYTQDDIKQIPAEDISDPGSYPYTRGIRPEMYRKYPWYRSIIVCYRDPGETNRAFKQLIEHGQTGLRYAGDLSSMSTVDPDHPLAKFNFDCNGSSVFGLSEYEEIFQDISLENIDLESASAPPAASLLAYVMVVALMEIRNENIANLRGSAINDYIHSWVVYRTMAFNDWDLAKKINLDLMEFAAMHTPKWHSCTPCGYDMREGGINSIQEIAFCIGNALQYYGDAINERGLEIDDFPGMVFSMSLEMDFFENIAKLRAMRRLWARIAKERLGAKKPRSMACRIGARTAGNTFFPQKIINNTSRTTIQILSGILGGAQSIDAASIDEPVGLPSEESRIFALDTQHILTHDANVASVADALGGSYFIESLTSKLEEEALELLKEIDEKGGMLECAKSGWLKEQFTRNAIKVENELRDKERLVVGVNAFEGDDGPVSKLIKENAVYTVPENSRKEKLEKFKLFKINRDIKRVKNALAQMWTTEKKGKNVIRACVEACKAHATIGEMIGTLRLAHELPYDPYGAIPTPEYLSEFERGTQLDGD